MNDENEIPPNIDFFIQRSLEAISYENVNMFRISFFEWYPTHSTMVSAGNQISREEVDRLYNKRLQRNSLQYELDLFYEKCLMNSVGTEINFFFQTKLLTPDQHLTFKDYFVKNERERYPKLLRKNKKRLRNRLKQLEHQGYLIDTVFQTKIFCPASAAMQEKMYFYSYHEANDRIVEDFKKSSDLAEILEYNMFNGFRATWVFDLHQGKPDEETIAQTIKENTWKLEYAESPNWDGWVQNIRERLIKDLNLRPGAK